MNIFNLLICGVGGQGVITSAEIISDFLVELGYEVRRSDLHGLAQRGGSVMSSVRFGEGSLYSPVIPQGQVDYLLGMDDFEIKKYALELKPNTGSIFQIEPQESALINNSKVHNVCVLIKWVAWLEKNPLASKHQIKLNDFITWLKKNLPKKILQKNLDAIDKLTF